MSRKARKEEPEPIDESANLTSTITALLTTKLAEHKTELLAEIRDTYARYEAKLDSVQTAVDDHKQRISNLEESANSTSTELMDIQATLTTLTADNAKLRAKVTELESRSRRNNIRIIGLPENIESSKPTAFFSQLLFDVFGTDILSTPPQLDRAHRTLTAKPGPSDRPRPVVICFHSFQTRELVVREARKLRGKLKYKDVSIHIVEDYAPEVLEQRIPYRGIMKRLYEMGLKPSLRYPARLFIVLDGGIRKFLPSVKEATDFAASWNPQNV